MPHPGQIAGVDARLLRYAYEGAPIFEIDISPATGTFAPSTPGGGPTVNVGGYVSGTSGFQIPLNLPRSSSDGSAEIIYVLEGVDIEYYRTGAGDTLSVSVNRWSTAAGGGATALFTWTQAAAFATTGAWTTYTNNALASNMDVSLYGYSLGFSLVEGAACRIGRVRARYTKLAVE